LIVLSLDWTDICAHNFVDDDIFLSGISTRRHTKLLTSRVRVLVMNILYMIVSNIFFEIVISVIINEIES
jgi:hypothetical protein